MIFVYVLGWILITITVIAITFGLFCWFSKKFFFHNKLEDIKINKPNLWIGLLLILSILIVFFAFLAPVLFTNSSSYRDFDTSTGAVGDTIGGIMNPFIALAAVIVTGLAFYMQYQANKQVQDQFKLQQFESQFYEMLRLHKDNVNEMELTVYEESKDDKDNVIFINPKVVKGREVFKHYVEEFHLILDGISESDFMKIHQRSFGTAYNYFFGGYSKFLNDEDLNFATLRKVCDAKKEIIKKHGTSENKHLNHYFDLFKGHHDKLGFYYRHLYMTVKFVVESYEDDGILKSEKECLKYLKILRGQLSNSEQVMLFYNWIAGDKDGYGAKWESKKYNRKYFSKYFMLHNLNFH